MLIFDKYYTKNDIITKIKYKYILSVLISNFRFNKMSLSRIVLPGDFITDSFNVVSTQAPRIVGFGLEKRKDGIYAVIAGVLVETENKLWLNTSAKRYTPHSGDRVLGTVTTKSGDFYRVDIGSPDLAQLNFTSFEGATKRNRPNVKVGDLLYGQIILTSKNLEPELSCIDTEKRAHGMGVIAAPGLVVTVPLDYARKLLKPNERIVTALGKEIKIEIIVGVNGKVWIGGEHLVVLLVRDAIIEAETTFESNIPILIQNTLEKINRIRGGGGGSAAYNQNGPMLMDTS